MHCENNHKEDSLVVRDEIKQAQFISVVASITVAKNCRKGAKKIKGQRLLSLTRAI